MNKFRSLFCWNFLRDLLLGHWLCYRNRLYYRFWYGWLNWFLQWSRSYFMCLKTHLYYLWDETILKDFRIWIGNHWLNASAQKRFFDSLDMLKVCYFTVTVNILHMIASFANKAITIRTSTLFYNTINDKIIGIDNI